MHRIFAPSFNLAVVISPSPAVVRGGSLIPPGGKVATPLSTAVTAGTACKKVAATAYKRANSSDTLYIVGYRQECAASCGEMVSMN